MYTQPGKKLLFMGSELAPMQEWDHDKSLPWELASEPIRASFGRYLEDLGALYLHSPALWASEPDPTTFAWIDVGDVEASVISYLRRGGGEVIAVIANLTPVVRHGYRIGLPSAGPWEEVLNTDSAHYGGSNVGNLGVIHAEPSSWHGQPASTHLTLPPLATLILRVAARSSSVPAA